MGYTNMIIFAGVYQSLLLKSSQRTQTSVHFFNLSTVVVFLQHVSIACYAERCISHSKSVRPSVRPSHAGTESKRLKLRSWGLHWRIAP